ncbi:MAG: pyruvate ferredoxin oxidoreductase [Firmicutes bacterium]|jgi:pyruvate ferredoxin oxidoreductase beta subunit|nr:pyruvate ferredoxin oxidoreductase [Bacillota bacterium]
MATLKELSMKDELLCGGHRACAGCAAPIAIRQALAAVDTDVVVGCATGCLEVTTTIYPYTAWNVPFIHSAFENSAATISGVETAYRALKKRGKIKRDIQFIAIGGDGGTYDIGLQSLSGAMERGHDMVYICYDNQAYMNTGIQRSSATPKGASTTTSPTGSAIPAGKVQIRKDLTEIMAAHHIPYAAQGAPSHWKDFMRKVKKALAVEGPAFINVLSPCRLGWRFDPAETIDIMRLAVSTCFWPLYEIENGVVKVNQKPRDKRPVREWLEKQGRFRHLFAPENEGLLEEIQKDIDDNWNRLLAREAMA